MYLGQAALQLENECEVYEKCNAEILADEIGLGLDELLQEFVDSTPMEILKMQGALKAKKLSTVRQTAHTLKTRCASIGLELFASYCSNIQLYASSAKHEQLAHELEYLDAYYFQVADTINSHLRKDRIYCIHG